MQLSELIRSQLASGDVVIPDPGDAGEIKSDGGLGVCKLTTAAAETRTVDAPTGSPDFALLLLQMEKDGGDCVVTLPAGGNATGNNTLTFADRGDWVVLAVGLANNTDTVAWRIIASDGVALSTV